MNQEVLFEQLADIAGSQNILRNEPMRNHTTFRIGGNADFFMKAVSPKQLGAVVKLLAKEKVPYFVIGNGSNLLVSDDGYRGVIIQIAGGYSGYEILHNETAGAVDKNSAIYIKANAGILLSKLGNEMAEKSLAGFEFATGIPGTIGGAVMMNAGAYGGEMKDVLVSATVMDKEGNIKTIDVDDLELGYRTSIVAREGYIVLDAVIALRPDNKADIKARISELAEKRRDKQPLEYPSAGSTFKRPEGYFAGKLISDAGLKGYTVGGAMVSEKHAGFVVNVGNATAADVIKLTDDVKKKIQETDGVTLELEVRKLGF